MKLFTGTATADRVLAAVAAAVRSSLASGAGDGWFFIRYGDPDWHLRLRVHGDPGRLFSETLPAIYEATAPLLSTGQIWRVQLDTYEREVERYGGDCGIEIAERIFHADSEAVLQILRGLDSKVSAELRWRVAIASIDCLFDDFGLTLEQKREIVTRACQGYGREFGSGSAFQRQVSRRYRQDRPGLESLLDREGEPAVPLRPSMEALRRRSTVIGPMAAELRRLSHRGQLSPALSEIAMSYAHMHVNRLLRSAQRVQEYVFYTLLDRLYSSQSARGAP